MRIKPIKANCYFCHKPLRRNRKYSVFIRRQFVGWAHKKCAEENKLKFEQVDYCYRWVPGI